MRTADCKALYCDVICLTQDVQQSPSCHICSNTQADNMGTTSIYLQFISQTT